MTIGVQYFITADYATIAMDSQKLSVNGFFDTFRTVLFPTQSSKFFIVSGFTGVNKEEEKITMVFTSPTGEVIAEAQSTIKGDDASEIVNIVLEFNEFPLPYRGSYLVTLFVGETLNKIGEYNFKADYQPQRIFAPDEVQKILDDPTLAKGSKINIGCPKCSKVFNYQLDLDTNSKLAEGYERFPEDNLLKCCDIGEKPLDLTGIRRQIEWGFGQKL